MLVTFNEFKDICVNKIREKPEAIAFDFETTGLNARKGDSAFLIGVAFSPDEVYSYFITGTAQDAFRILFSSPTTRYLAHNAKFEMTFLDHQFGVQINGEIWDTEVMAKLMYNNHYKYSLQACAERIGSTKYKPMADWIKVNGPQYDKAPRDIIVPYVEQDARLSYLLYLEQRDMFREWQKSSVPIAPSITLELATTKNLYAMERTGIRVDIPYCRNALDYELQRMQDSSEEFKKLTGVEFVDSRKTLAPVFDSLGIKYNTTPKGNASFDYASMKPHLDNQVVQAILTHRDATKRSSTYWENFLGLEVNGRIHADIRQSGAAATGRMSAASPNVQNWTDDSEDPSCAYPIRRAFVADHGCRLVSIDYAQMELRLMADEAEEFEMIAAIKNGTDFHQQVADAAGVPRGIAKNARFAKLYGAGSRKISAMLGVDEGVVKRVIREIDMASPRIMSYSRRLTKDAERHGFIFNWLGRRYFFDKGFEYKAPNYRIQGGCAEILKIAINDVLTYIKENNLRMKLILPIHDELVFNVPESELHLIGDIKSRMIGAYRSKKRLEMDVSVAIGYNLHDMESFI